MKPNILAAGAALLMAATVAAADKPDQLALIQAPLRLELTASEPGKLEAVLHNTSDSDQEYLVEFSCCAPSQRGRQRSGRAAK